MVIPLKEIISEEEFLDLLQPQASVLLKTCSFLNEKGNNIELPAKIAYLRK